MDTVWVLSSMLLVFHCPCSGYLPPRNQLPPNFTGLNCKKHELTGQEFRKGLAEWFWLRVSREVKVIDQCCSHLKTQLKGKRERERLNRRISFKLIHVVGRFNFLTGYWIRASISHYIMWGSPKNCLHHDASWQFAHSRASDCREGERERLREEGEKERQATRSFFFFFFIQRGLLVLSDSSLGMWDIKWTKLTSSLPSFIK